MALHGAVHLAIRQRMVDVRGAHGLAVPSTTQDTATASEAGWLYDAVCLDLAFYLLRSPSTFVSFRAVVHEQPARNGYVRTPSQRLSVAVTSSTGTMRSICIRAPG